MESERLIKEGGKRQVRKKITSQDSGNKIKSSIRRERKGKLIFHIECFSDTSFIFI